MKKMGTIQPRQNRKIALGLCLSIILVWTMGGAQVPAQGTADQKSRAVEPSLPSVAAEASSTTLVEEAAKWNGRKIIFTGEAVGEGMVRGLKCWIHLNDDAYMWKNIEEGAKLGGYNSGQAIWVDAGLVRKITYYGNYLHEGDIVKVTGTFNSVCRDHGGDMDIHADTLEIVRIGHPVGHVINYRRAVLALILLGLAGILFWIRSIARRYRT
jgi:hypothetical protein